MLIYDCKVNHLINPLGFRMTRTVFSWKVKEAQGKRQTQARIQIAGDRGMKAILADTGWDTGADSLGYKVEVELLPRTCYYWTVSVRSDAGEEAVSEIQWFETGKREEPWTGKWITCDSTEKRHPLFEKEIRPGKPVKNARLYLCGLGLYEAFYSGERIGEEYLTPYSNDYNEWVQYQTYDVTGQMQESGKLAVLLGNGWYKARFGFHAHEDRGFYGDEWKLIAELRLEYEDGTEEVVGTDESWQVRRSRITFSNLYDGEWQDDTLEEMPAESVRLCEPPKGELTDRMSLPVTRHEEFAPAELIYTPAGEQVFDLGQEITGVFTLRVHEPRGTKIHIQTGEILQQGNFYNENLRTAKSEYVYISDGKEHVLMPHFTFYGYRYVKVQGVSELKKEDFRGIALYSSLKRTGDIRTGHALVNRLVENIRWGLKDNFLDVPTDCPQRDERMGWTGDAQVFSATASYLKDTYAFYAKYLYDMAKEQSVLDGKVPDVVPSAGIDSTACVWGDASCIIPWNLYLFYGDRSILEDQFESMKSWVDYVRRVDGENHGWRYVFHYGDWLALDNLNQTAEQVMGGTDEEFIANLYYAVSAGLVAKAAQVLGKEQEEREYRALSEEQFEIVRKEYYSVTGRCCIKTQTALLLTLKYKLSGNEELVKSQLRKLYDDNNGKLRTGFVGTPLMCNILSDYGMEDIAYGLLLNEEYPGWLAEVKLGATTVWERWNSLLPDGTISGISMNSMNHYSYGAIAEWMFRHVAGINTMDSAPGLRRVSLQPSLNWELGTASASYDSACGEYRCGWKLTDPEHAEIEVSIPFGGMAELHLPYAPESVMQENGNPMFRNVRDGVCILEAGDYSVAYELTQSLKKQYTMDSTWQELFNNHKIARYLTEELEMDIPQQYKNRSVKELAETFASEASGGKLEKLEKFLRGI